MKQSPIAINKDITIHNDNVNYNEEFDFSALRAKLAQKAESTTTKKLNIVVNLDEHYKSQREKKLLDVKKKYEAKEYLKSFHGIANNANKCDDQQEMAVDEAQADAVDEPDSTESKLPADGECEERIESSRQIELSDGQESEQDPEQDPVSDLSRGLVDAQVESIECENQYECEHAIVIEGAEPFFGQCSEMAAAREGAAINNTAVGISSEKDSTLQQSQIEAESVTGSDHACEQEVAAINNAASAISSEKDIALQQTQIGAENVNVLSNNACEQEGTEVNNTAVNISSENGSALQQSQQRVDEVLIDMRQIPSDKHLLVPPQRNFLKIFQACGYGE